MDVAQRNNRLAILIPKKTNTSIGQSITPIKVRWNIIAVKPPITDEAINVIIGSHQVKCQKLIINNTK